MCVFFVGFDFFGDERKPWPLRSQLLPAHIVHTEQDAPMQSELTRFDANGGYPDDQAGLTKPRMVIGTLHCRQVNSGLGRRTRAAMMTCRTS